MLTLNNFIAGYPKGFKTSPKTMIFDEGRVVAVVGPNGSGKTTFFKTLLGLIRPYSGNYLWKRDYRFGYLPQFGDLNTVMPMKVVEVLETLNHHSELELKKLHDPFEITPLLKKSFHQCSGGQKQRILITRVLLTQPEIIFLDEPNNYLDEKTRIIFWDFLRSKEKMKTLNGIFIIEHERTQIEKYADHVLELEEPA